MVSFIRFFVIRVFEIFIMIHTKSMHSFYNDIINQTKGSFKQYSTLFTVLLLNSESINLVALSIILTATVLTNRRLT